MANTVVACTNINLLKESQIPAVPNQNELYAIEMELSSYTPNILDFKWSDYLLNDQSWTRADTFSWQDGTVYSTAYNHLSADISGKTLQSETIGAITVQFYLADDGHKICPASEESNVASIYTNTGVAWYYILDTANRRFKLPRSKYNAYASQIAVKGNGKTLSWTNGNNDYGSTFQTSGAWGIRLSENPSATLGESVGETSIPTLKAIGITTDPTISGMVADLPTQDLNLYFYVGEFSQTATEQTAGLNAELFNGKVDISSLSEVQTVIETYVNGTSGYRIWSDGYCEQWGSTMTSTYTIYFLKKFSAVPNMTWGLVTTRGSASYDGEIFFRSVTATNFVSGSRLSDVSSPGFMWRACGYLAEDEY